MGSFSASASLLSSEFGRFGIANQTRDKSITGVNQNFVDSHRPPPPISVGYMEIPPCLNAWKGGSLTQSKIQIQFSFHKERGHDFFALEIKFPILKN